MYEVRFFGDEFVSSEQRAAAIHGETGYDVPRLSRGTQMKTYATFDRARAAAHTAINEGTAFYVEVSHNGNILLVLGLELEG